MKKIIFLALSILLTFNGYGYNLVADCNNCTTNQLQQKATQTASALSSFGYVYVFNFTDHVLHKYFAWEENNDYQMEDGKIDYNSVYEYLESHDITKKQVLKIFVNDNNRGQSFMIVTKVTTSISERTSFDQIDSVLNRFGGITDIEGEFPAYLDNPQTGGTIGSDFGAYDIVGNASLARSLFNQVSDDAFSQNIISALQGLQTFLNIFKGINIEMNINVIIHLPNGSIGIANLKHGELAFKDSEFIDSDGNPVPFNASDVSGRTFFFRNGRGSSGFNGFVRRINLLGIGHNSSSGNGKCTFVCSGDNCTLTCQAN